MALPPAPLFALDDADAARGIRLYNEGRYAESKAVLERVAEDGRAGPLELTVLGMAHTMLGEYEQATIVLEEAEALDPFSAAVHVASGVVAFQQGAYGSARDCFELAMRFDPDSPQAREGMVASLANLAITSYESGDLEDADRRLVAARAFDADNPALIEMLIEVRTKRGGAGSLAGLYLDLVRVQPENGDAFARLGTILEQEGDEAAAREAFLEAERFVTERPYPYLYLARYGLAHGAPQAQTVSRLHSAIGKAVRESDRIHVQAAVTLEQAQGAFGAEQMDTLDRLSRLSQQPVRIFKRAMSLLAELRTTAELEADLRRMREWYPHSVELGVEMGRFLEGQGRFTEAEAHWRKLLRDIPTLPEAHFGLGRALEHTGRFAAAQSAYFRARDLDPENPEVYSALWRLSRAAGDGAPEESGAAEDPGPPEGPDAPDSPDGPGARGAPEAPGALRARRVLAEPALLGRYGEFAERERTNPVLLDAMAEIEEALGLAEEAEAHRRRASELRERDGDQNS